MSQYTPTCPILHVIMYFFYFLQLLYCYTLVFVHFSFFEQKETFLNENKSKINLDLQLGYYGSETWNVSCGNKIGVYSEKHPKFNKNSTS